MSKIILKIIGFIGLGLTLVPSILVFNKIISLQDHKNYMLIGFVLWLISSLLLENLKPKTKEI
jgi:hypothetical protein